MNIKKSYYCITDKNNKPDFRYLFTDPKDAHKKIRQIKNSTKGETLLISKNQRDFFVDGVKRDLIDPFKKMTIKKGCWTGLQVKECKVLDTVDPKKLYKKIILAEQHQYDFSKVNLIEETEQIEQPRKLPIIPNPLVNFEWENSIFRTKSFAAGLVSICLATVFSVFYIHNSSNAQVVEQLSSSQKTAQEKMMALQTKVLNSKDESIEKQAAEQFDESLNKFVLDTMQNFQNLKQDEFESRVAQILNGSPMEQMVPFIVKQDRTVAAFLVGIAKKESNWGRHVPVLAGQDCFNYWGYRGIRARMGTGGHTCFDSPEDAVNTVANRIQDLVQSDVDTPQEMVIWKCGSACNQDGQAGKWITDVSAYFHKVEEPTQPKEKSPNERS